MEIGIALLVGALLGAGSFFLGTKNQPPNTDTTATQQQEIIKQLTDLDIVEKLCTPEKPLGLEEKLLCREMTCLVYSRGIDSQTSGQSCEEISNILNTISMIDYCKTHTTEGSICYEVFYRRK